VLRAAEDLSQLGHVAEVVARRAVERLNQIDGDWKLFINAHPKELIDPPLLQKRLDILEKWKDRVVIEITERTYLLELSQWSTSVRMLSEAGFALAVDDLGSGYNSLVVLAELQPQYLKVDMSMTRSVHLDPRKQRLIEMLVRFADSTDALVVAEGIEAPEEAEALLDCGVHYLQGYFFGHPTTDVDMVRDQIGSVLPLPRAARAAVSR
jgi:EAL domain-containing protein (putative c-di-GMP-specific phosphodiesterase class I)